MAVLSIFPGVTAEIYINDAPATEYECDDELMIEHEDPEVAEHLKLHTVTKLSSRRPIRSTPSSSLSVNHMSRVKLWITPNSVSMFPLMVSLSQMYGAIEGISTNRVQVRVGSMGFRDTATRSTKESLR